MGLKEEIAAKRKEIVVDSYPMSIGEVILTSNLCNRLLHKFRGDRTSCCLIK